MYFEGPEKKLELKTTESIDLLGFPEQYWHDLLKECGATILHQISNDLVKAFLISESSLFVWKNKVLLITCGQTQLIKSAEMLIDKLGVENIQNLYFARKNEHYPDFQKTFSFSDFQKLKSILGGGEGLRFGRRDSHHFHLFEYINGEHDTKDKEQLLEALIYGIGDEMTDAFLRNNPEDRKKIETIVSELLPGYQLDHHWFAPCGYSLNACKGKEYAAVHVTPEKDQSYISFEMSHVKPTQALEIISKLKKAFSPRALDLMYYSDFSVGPLQLDWSEMRLHQTSFATLESGTEVSYYHWEPIQDAKSLPPVKLNLE